MPMAVDDERDRLPARRSEVEQGLGVRRVAPGVDDDQAAPAGEDDAVAVGLARRIEVAAQQVDAVGDALGSGSAGGAAPGGGGGMLRPTKTNMRPVKCSGGQVANAIRPPGLSTRRISAMATSGRGANMWPNWLSTTSNDASG